MSEVPGRRLGEMIEAGEANGDSDDLAGSRGPKGRIEPGGDVVARG